MNIKKVIVSLATAMTATAMMLTTMPAAQVSAATIKNDQSKVVMYSRDSQLINSFGTIYRDFIKVAKSISYGKVYLNYKGDNGVWQKEDTKFLTSLDDNYNIYVADKVQADWNSESYVSVEANGDTYIDDNNGKNYTTENCGVSPLCVLRSNNTYFSAEYSVDVALKNLAYQKDVRVRYTLDNWKTYKEAPLYYVSTEDNGEEYWHTTINTEGTTDKDFHFAVSYTVNGQTYWDNNFKQNYDISYNHQYV